MAGWTGVGLKGASRGSSRELVNWEFHGATESHRPAERCCDDGVTSPSLESSVDRIC